MAGTANPCPEQALAALIATIEDDEAAGLAKIETLIEAHPGDARLPFLKGSLLAGAKRYDRALAAMAAAVELDPGYAIARFQYGFLTLTSGDAAGAEAIWAPLGDLGEDHYLRRFAEGLGHLIHDRFAEAVDALRKGIARNTENPPLNADMQLLIDAVGGPPDPDAPDPSSSVQSLLQQYAARGTRH